MRVTPVTCHLSPVTCHLLPLNNHTNLIMPCVIINATYHLTIFIMRKKSERLKIESRALSTQSGSFQIHPISNGHNPNSINPLTCSLYVKFAIVSKPTSCTFWDIVLRSTRWYIIQITESTTVAKKATAILKIKKNTVTIQFILQQLFF